MTPVYMVTLLTNMRDFAAYEAYAAQARRVVAAHGGRFIIASHGYLCITAVEGAKPDVVNVAVFPTRESFDSFYSCAEYQPLIEERSAFCSSQILMLERL